MLPTVSAVLTLSSGDPNNIIDVWSPDIIEFASVIGDVRGAIERPFILPGFGGMIIRRVRGIANGWS